MATITERAHAIVDAIRNETVLGPKLEEMAQHFIYYRWQDLIGMELDPENLTIDEKARVMVTSFEEWAKTIARDFETIEVAKESETRIQDAQDDWVEVII